MLDYVTYAISGGLAVPSMLAYTKYKLRIVGEPKSRIVQKHTFFASERYTAGILYTDSLNSA